jgi:protein-S-isoprenylcysteine O-methyltransferase Ste14
MAFGLLRPTASFFVDRCAGDPMTGITLVTLQFALLLALAWPFSEPVRPMSALTLFLAAAALGAWTLAFNRPGNFNIRPELKPGARFVRGGPYSHVRHPMYVSVLLAGLAAVVLYGGWIKLLCWAALFAVLWIKAGIEERAMAEHFPEYRDYAATVGRFFPR